MSSYAVTFASTECEINHIKEGAEREQSQKSLQQHRSTRGWGEFNKKFNWSGVEARNTGDLSVD